MALQRLETHLHFLFSSFWLSALTHCILLPTSYEFFFSLYCCHYYYSPNLAWKELQMAKVSHHGLDLI